MRISTPEFIALMAMLVATVALSIDAMFPALPNIAAAALNWSEKFRRFVILVSIYSVWIQFSTLSEFTGPLQLGGHKLLAGTEL
jgi:MFS transporter, DHA1 family, multidrug resistance protein